MFPSIKRFTFSPVERNVSHCKYTELNTTPKHLLSQWWKTGSYIELRKVTSEKYGPYVKLSMLSIAYLSRKYKWVSKHQFVLTFVIAENYSFRTRKEIFIGMSQGSVNGPKWFNLYLNDLLFLFATTEVRYIADDSTLYACHWNIMIM